MQDEATSEGGAMTAQEMFGGPVMEGMPPDPTEDAPQVELFTLVPTWVFMAKSVAWQLLSVAGMVLPFADAEQRRAIRDIASQLPEGESLEHDSLRYAQNVAGFAINVWWSRYLSYLGMEACATIAEGMGRLLSEEEERRICFEVGNIAAGYVANPLDPKRGIGAQLENLIIAFWATGGLGTVVARLEPGETVPSTPYPYLFGQDAIMVAFERICADYGYTDPMFFFEILQEECAKLDNLLTEQLPYSYIPSKYPEDIKLWFEAAFRLASEPPITRVMPQGNRAQRRKRQGR